MTISGINNGIANFSQPSQAVSTGSTARVGGGADGDGDNDGSGAKKVGGGGRSGFASAVSQALSQLGLAVASGSTNAAAGEPTSTQDPQQAIRTFMHDLFVAMRSQGNGQQATAASGADRDGDGSGTSDVTGAPKSGYGAGGIEGRLQNLIQQLSSSSNSSSSGSGSSGAVPSNNSALATLQQDFQNLMSAQGGGGGQATLGSFLQALSQNLHGANPAGNIVSTRA